MRSGGDAVEPAGGWCDSEEVEGSSPVASGSLPQGSPSTIPW